VAEVLKISYRRENIEVMRQIRGKGENRPELTDDAEEQTTRQPAITAKQHSHSERRQNQHPHGSPTAVTPAISRRASRNVFHE